MKSVVNEVNNQESFSALHLQLEHNKDSSIASFPSKHVLPRGPVGKVGSTEVGERRGTRDVEKWHF